MLHNLSIRKNSPTLMQQSTISKIFAGLHIRRRFNPGKGVEKEKGK